MDVLEAVIGLGSNIFYGASLAACVLIFRANKPDKKENKVLFIDASDQVRIGRAQNYLDKEHVDTIYRWYSDFKNVENHVKVATLKDIKANDFNLNIPLYVEKKIENNLPSMEEAARDLQESLKATWESEEKLKGLLKEFSLL
jgi:type I restriction enzyme M protein